MKNFNKLFLCLGLVLIILLISSCRPISNCSSRDIIDASINVAESEKKIIGFNTDTKSLKFGHASPGVSVKRIIEADYSKETEVIVEMDGEFSSWTKITPSRFNLNAGEKKEVSFEVTIPNHAPVGEYQGKAVFCFIEN